MKNIVLIGMPGSGKSTVGVVLAKMLGLHFLDSDLVIQETEGKLLSEIIEEKGPDGFLLSLIHILCGGCGYPGEGYRDSDDCGGRCEYFPEKSMAAYAAE